MRTAKSNSVLLSILLIGMLAGPMVSPALADEGDGNLLQAQDIIAIFDEASETTTVTWRNYDTNNGTLWTDMTNSRYLVYRSAVQMNESMVLSGSVLPFANISACPPIYNLNECPGLGHSVQYPLGPGVNGTFYYGVSTILPNGTISALMLAYASQIGEPVYEYTHSITAPFNVKATFDPTTSRTLIQWINLNELSPGSLPDVGPFAYHINVYRHSDPANRSSWASLEIDGDRQLIGMLGPGNNSFTFTVPPGTDQFTYYSVTYVLEGYEDTRFLGSNTLDPEWPVWEDNVAPGLLIGGVTAEFQNEPVGGTGNTTITWYDMVSETDATYHVWRSGSMFNDTTNPYVEYIATVGPGVESYVYEVERGTLGYAYYAVTVSDGRGNHNDSITSQVIGGPVLEDAFTYWVAEPTNVQAEYIGGGQTSVTWIDQVGAEGETYHVWYSRTTLSATSNLSNPDVALLVATVPDGVQQAIVDTPPDIEREAFYCVTSETRYNHLNATFESTEFVQNCIEPSVFEDTQAPTPAQLAQPQLQGAQQSVLLGWMNSLESGESYDIYRHLGDPFANNESGNITDDPDWELLIADYTPPDIDQSSVREVYLTEGLDRWSWYALTITDSWGNQRVSLTNRSNAWLIHEDTTAPEAEITINGFPGGSLPVADHRLTIDVSEPVQEHPIIVVTTEDYDPNLGIGLTFTPAGELIRAQSLLGSTSRYYWDFPIVAGIETTNLVVSVTLIDTVGNSNTLVKSDWIIDANRPTIDLFSPSSESRYLYGDNIRVHGVVSDDVGLLEVTFHFIEVKDFGYENIFEWELVTDVTPADAEPNILVFDMREPSATFRMAGFHRLEIKAVDLAGNERVAQTIFYVDHCYENMSGFTICASGDDPIAGFGEEEESIPTLRDPPYIIIIMLAGFNVLMLLFALMMGVLASQDPRRKARGDGGGEFDEEDDWMMEFMGSGDGGGPSDVGGDLDAAPERDLDQSKALDDDDDPFAEIETTTKRRKKSKKSKKSRKKEVEEDDEDEGDDEDDWGDEDDEDEPARKKKPKKRGKKGSRRSIKRKKSD
uniref:Uncharacterized protein n=1 Tax=uncultured marine group II/III euryarchaeote KM3_155_E06 TaxID=1457897 RepID=A0A075GDS1_9EURY|nr:hypothetical protein [uncultured marine group II/III euryarchaeote KM3_155_E06]